MITSHTMHFLDLLARVGSSLYGWVLACLCGAVAFFAPEAYAFYVVFVSIALDGAFGVAVSIKCGRFALSELGRLTLIKVSTYCAALGLAYMVERLGHESGIFVGVRIVATWAAACEFWSWSASVLIMWPGCPFVRLLRRHLRGEIASKTGQDVSDVFPEG